MKNNDLATFLEIYEKGIIERQEADNWYYEWVRNLQEDFISRWVTYCDSWLSYIKNSPLSSNQKKPIIDKLETLRKRYLMTMSLSQFELGMQMMLFRKTDTIREAFNSKRKLILSKKQEREYFSIWAQCSREFNPIWKIIALENEIVRLLASAQKIIQYKSYSWAKEDILVPIPQMKKASEFLETHSNSPQSPQQKIDQIHVRLDNILSSVPDDRYIPELEKMRQRVIDLGSLNGSMQELCNNVLSRIDAAFDLCEVNDSWAEVITPPQEETHHKEWAVLVGELFEENKKFLEYIRFMRAEAITYNLSSTRWGESVWDGNFIAHVWRPFLAHLEWLMERNIFDAAEFSWNKVISSIENNHDGLNQKYRLRSFLDMLRKYENTNTWRENWKCMIDVVDEFAENKQFFLVQNGIRPLMNFRQELINNPPPIR